MSVVSPKAGLPSLTLLGVASVLRNGTVRANNHNDDSNETREPNERKQS